MKKTITLISAIAISIAGFAQNNYTLDKQHARLTFTALHIGISHIDGIFKIFDATLVSSKDDFSDAEIEMNADANSLTTEVVPRDEDLRDNFLFSMERGKTLTQKNIPMVLPSRENWTERISISGRNQF